MPTHIQIGDVTPRVQIVIDTEILRSGPWTYAFPIFENTNLEVYYDGEKKDLDTHFTISGAGESEGGTVTPVVGQEPALNTIVTMTRRLNIERTSDFQESGEFRAKVLNDELDYLTAALQQVSDDQARSSQMAITETASVDMTLPSPQADAVIAWNGSGDGFVNGPSITEVSNAQAYAEAAQASANTALLAQSYATGGMFSSNVQKSGDFTVGLVDNGKQFLIDTSAGDVVVTLPDSGDVYDGFRFAVAKISTDNNAVIVNRAGTDTINGAVSWQFDTANAQSIVSLDTDTIPDSSWYATGVGVSSPVGVSDLADSAKPYDIAFIAGFDAVMSAEDIEVQTYGELVMTRDGVFAGEAGYIDVAPVGAAAIVDIEKNGISVYATKPQFVASANALSAGILKSDGSESFATGDRVTFKVTQTGTSSAGQGLRFTVMGVLV